MCKQVLACLFLFELPFLRALLAEILFTKHESWVKNLLIFEIMVILDKIRC